MLQREPSQVAIVAALLGMRMTGTPGNTPYSAAIDATLLCRMARVLDRIHERECNGYHSEARRIQDERLEERTTEHIKAICKEHHLKPEFQDDPRGCSLRLYRESEVMDSWHGVACF